jgi:3-phenylpropionate/trans-cinnamate dioxygenase ferredoxin reductase component
MKSNLVIIGSGHAGGMAAIALRQNKYRGSITLIGEEEFLPYQRPALSKDYLQSKLGETSLYLKSKKYYEDKDITIIPQSTVTRINSKNKTIVCNENTKIDYSILIIATGSLLNKLNYSNFKIHYLRTIPDADAIKNILNKKKKIGIIGSGYIGLEIASIAAANNTNVNIIEMEDRVMKRTSSKNLSIFFEKKHKSKGIIFHFNSTIQDIRNSNNKKQILLKSGAVIEVDEVIAGVGVKANDKLAIMSDIECDNGIIVNEYCKTSEDDIFAIGDCTVSLNNTIGRNIRLESVHNAVEQAKTVASFITGNPIPYNQVPWFWSNQYDLKLQIAGLYQAGDNILIRGSMENEKFSIFGFRDNKLISVESINSQKDFMVGKKLIEKAISKSNHFTDLNFDLRALLN